MPAARTDIIVSPLETAVCAARVPPDLIARSKFWPEPEVLRLNVALLPACPLIDAIELEVLTLNTVPCVPLTLNADWLS